LQNYVIQVLKVKMLIDIELLIELYRSEKGLWDSDNANYLNMDVMQVALRRIAGRMVPKLRVALKSTIFILFHKMRKC